MDKLVSIRAFVRVVTLGSFSGAARELRLSRSAISKYIADLEEDLGVQLLNRTTRSASATENGRVYFERCVEILADLEEADRMAAHLQVHPRGVLRVNAPMSFGTLHLSTAIADFMLLYPDLQVQLILSDQQIDAVQEGFDVTLRIADIPSTSLIARKLSPAPRVFCAAPDYLRARGTPTIPGDLKQHDCLSYGYLSTGMQWKLTGPDGDHWVQVPWRLCTNNAEVLRDAAVRGLGIALLPTFIAANELRTGKLRPVLETFRAPEMSLCALYAPTRHLPLKVRLFIDYLVERFNSPLSWELGHAEKADVKARRKTSKVRN